MKKPVSILNSKEEEQVIEAIRIAERNTSGEIRVHIEPAVVGKAFDRAVAVFQHLKMQNTQLRNGILIYLAVKDKVFAIYGDKGINEVVPDDFWNATRDLMASYFKKGNFKQGLVDGILRVGKELQQHFPWHAEDKNELDDTISTGSF